MLRLLAQSRSEAVFDQIREMVCVLVARHFRTVSVPAFRLWLKKQWQQAHRPRLAAPDLLRWARGRRFDVVVADPPWPNCTNWTLSENAFYPRMRVSEIGALPVGQITAERSLLFLWTTSMFLMDAIRVLLRWGFRFCGYAFIWVKRTKNGKPAHGFGPTYYTAKCTELVLMGSKGHAPIAQQHVLDLLDTQRREHSRKPDEFWAALERYLGPTYPSRVELFAREKRKGYATWGNEVKNF
jgi:N6-adenosine-specific RNA methylase IME4